MSRCLLAALLLTGAASAQDDRVLLASGAVVTAVRVLAWELADVRWQTEAGPEATANDGVLLVEPARAVPLFAEARAARDGGRLLGLARARLQAHDELAAQYGWVLATRACLDAGDERGVAAAGDALDELAKALPAAGALPALHRLRCHGARVRGDARGLQAAARNNQAAATAGGWPAGCLQEAEFLALAGDALAGTVHAASYRARLLDLRAKAGNGTPLADAVDLELAGCLAAAGEREAARRLLDTVLQRDPMAVDLRAEAWLRCGRLLLAAGEAGDREAFRAAMLAFLRVRIEAADCWRRLGADSLDLAMLAAEKWQGEDWRLVRARCRALLLAGYADTEAGQRAKEK